MQWKEFFKPSIIKILLAIIIFIAIPVPFIFEGCSVLIDCMGNYCPCPQEKIIHSVVLRFGYQFLLDDTPITNDLILILSNIGLIITSYLIACVLLFIFDKHIKHKILS